MKTTSHTISKTEPKQIKEHNFILKTILPWMTIYILAGVFFICEIGYCYGLESIQSMSSECVIVGVISLVLICIIYDYLKCPFSYPKIIERIDISGRRQPSYDECVEEWLLTLNGHDETLRAMAKSAINDWDEKCDNYLRRTIFWKQHKRELYETMRYNVTRDDYDIFVFEFYRQQTRYRQRNYQKTAYKVDNVEFDLDLSLEDILDIDAGLRLIGYETTLEKYNSKNQRKLMTKTLRKAIMERDNYTCQLCGKYMPDKVGLHVDHIIPIKAGGKTVESNLQVLCDKCNLGKGSKVD